MRRSFLLAVAVFSACLATSVVPSESLNPAEMNVWSGSSHEEEILQSRKHVRRHFNPSEDLHSSSKSLILSPFPFQTSEFQFRHSLLMAEPSSGHTFSPKWRRSRASRSAISSESLPSSSSAGSFPGSSCELFSSNNRLIYECHNVSLTQIPPLPAGATTLIMRHTRLTSLPAINSTQLRSLILQWCQLRTIGPRTFAHAINLRELDLSHNHLVQLSFRDEDEAVSSPLSIERLVLAYNKLEVVPDLRPLKRLIYLDLSNNAIKTIPPNHLLLPRLEWINLSENALHTVRRDDFSRTTSVVELDDNPWLCDCELRDFVRFQKEALITRSLKCAGPPPLTDIRWDDLVFTDFACGPEIENADVEEVVEAVEGGEIIMRCEAWADPEPVLEWRRNASEEAIAQTSRLSLTSTSTKQGTVTLTLQLQYARVEDEDIYWCHATSGFNTRTKRYAVRIRLRSTPQSPIDAANIFRNGKERLSVPGEREKQDEVFEDESPMRGNPLWAAMVAGIALLTTLLLIAFCTFLICSTRLREGNDDRRSERRRQKPDRRELIERNTAERNRGDDNGLQKRQPQWRTADKRPDSKATSEGDVCTATVVVTAPCDVESISDADHTRITPTSSRPPSARPELARLKQGTVPNSDAQHAQRSDQMENEGFCVLMRQRLDDWKRKAPLAQYDRDTSILPIVQTSL